jgi:hypothetical protein
MRLGISKEKQTLLGGLIGWTEADMESFRRIRKIM